MEYSGTKQKILEVSLDLFSRYGYEATTVNMIADAVGMKKPSLYSHFKNKNDIFEKLLFEASSHYSDNTYFSKTDWDHAENIKLSSVFVSPEVAADKACELIEFLVTDPMMSKTRKLLTIEQFRDNTFAEIQEKRVYGDIIKYHTGLMRFLISNGVLKKEDPYILALNYVSPVSVLLQRIDRYPDRKEESLELIKKHILSFYKTYCQTK